MQLGERKDKSAAMFIDGAIDEVRLATITKRADERAKEIAEVLAKAGWRSPLEPLANGNIAAVWESLSLAQKLAPRALSAWRVRCETLDRRRGGVAVLSRSSR